MAMKRTVMYYGAVSLLIAFISSGCQAAQPQKQTVIEKASLEAVKTDTGKIDSGKAETVSGRKIVVYYFHGNMRCHTCLALEGLAKEAVETNFAKSIKKGRLEWKTVNVEAAGNEHFTNDYKLYTRSVIVSTLQDGKEMSWKNLDRIWTLVRDEEKYKEYITSEVKSCLEGKCL
jgi:Fe-S cluster biogenesis protein NfuA